MDKKLTIEFIRKEFEKESYQLLTTEYINNVQKLEYMCPKGHKGNIAWNNWNQGKRCLECSGKKQKTIEFIRKEFEKEGYRLLTNKYKNAQQKLEYICPKGHFGAIRWSGWNNGSRCLECGGTKKKTIEFIRKEFEKEGYELLTKEYTNSSQKLEYICPENHHGTIRWNGWSQGKRCAECASIQFSGSGNPHWRNYTEKEVEQFEMYKANVVQLTNQNFCKYYYYINPRKLPRSCRLYHVDHIFSVRNGFDNSISPRIIASTINLQMLPAVENQSKRDKSDMTKEMLYDLYYQFEKEVKEHEGEL